MRNSGTVGQWDSGHLRTILSFFHSPYCWSAVPSTAAVTCIGTAGQCTGTDYQCTGTAGQCTGTDYHCTGTAGQYSGIAGQCTGIVGQYSEIVGQCTEIVGQYSGIVGQYIRFSSVRQRIEIREADHRVRSRE